MNEKDIFIRYAVNLGVQEILFYVMEKIFSNTSILGSMNDIKNR